MTHQVSGKEKAGTFVRISGSDGLHQYRQRTSGLVQTGRSGTWEIFQL